MMIISIIKGNVVSGGSKLELMSVGTTFPETMNSPFRYAGGKFYARQLILEYLPPHRSYVEPFAGGASIFFAKYKVAENWLNDIDEELMNCLIHIRDYPYDLIGFLHGLPATKELHAYYKNEFKPATDLERAGRWYYLNRTSYSGIMNRANCYWGYGDKYSMRPENWPRNILRTSHKLQCVRLTSLDFADVLAAIPPGSFLFIDPPYFNASQDKFYVHSFTLEDHLRLANILKAHCNSFKFLLTYDNADEVREMYAWASCIVDKEWNYTISRTDDQRRTDDVRTEKGKRYKGQEVFIMNY